jgi:hypothetical protein
MLDKIFKSHCLYKCNGEIDGVLRVAADCMHGAGHFVLLYSKKCRRLKRGKISVNMLFQKMGLVLPGLIHTLIKPVSGMLHGRSKSYRYSQGVE